MRLHCTSCNYVFSSKTPAVPNHCPYCSKPGSLEKAKSAQDWINEVSAEPSED